MGRSYEEAASPRPVGHGLPFWLDTDEYLSADETRALGKVVFKDKRTSDNWGSGVCVRCGHWKRLQGAHVVRVGSSGHRKRGTDGPKARLCYDCHTDIDQHQATMTMAVRRRDHALCLVLRDGPSIVMVSGEYEPDWASNGLDTVADRERMGQYDD